jgi:type IV pilus assembly protein PilO
MNKILTRIAFLTTKQVGIFALLVGGLYWYAIFDDGSSFDPQIAALKEQVQQQEATKIATESALKKRDHLQETLADLTAKYENLSRLVPTGMTSSELNRQIDQLRKTSRINPIYKKPSEIKQGLILDEWPVQLKFIGAYNDIAQFIYQTSTTEKVMLVRKFKIVPMQPYDGRLSFDVSVSAFTLSSTPAPTEGQAQ